MIAALLAELWPYLAGLLGVIAGALGLYAKGQSDAKAKQETRDLRENIKTREKIDEADIVGDDPSAAARWLRERDANQR